MIGVKVNKAKSMFFDSKAVMSRVDKATRKVLSRFGAFVRTAARSSIRKRKRPSAPGSPPSSHTGLLKKFIYFGFDVAAQSVVIGPTRLNEKAGDAPAALEEGGRSTVVQHRRGRQRRRTINVAARPFMGPAFQQEKPKLPDMWRASVKA